MREEMSPPDGDRPFLSDVADTEPTDSGEDPLAEWRRHPFAPSRTLLPSAAGHVSPHVAAPAPTPDWRPEPAADEEPPSAPVLPVPRRLSGAGGPVSPLRALAGASVAVAGVLLGIGALLWATDAPKGSPALQQTQASTSRAVTASTPNPSAAASAALPTLAPVPPVTTSVAPTAAAKLPVTVLNNSNRNGLAKRVAARFRAAGWPIRETGGFRGRIPVTTVYYAPGQEASAQALQRAFPAIQRVRPRFSTLPGSGLTVVLTRDYPG